MSSFEPQIQCSNPDCQHSDNPLGQKVCANCQTPLTYLYLWAVSEGGDRFSVGELVGGRYYVIGSRLWLDTQPALEPYVPQEFPDEVIPYLHLYPQRLHVPEANGFLHPDLGQGREILLLENIPVDGNGRPQAAIAAAWSEASAPRQVYWLWQMLQLWSPLLEFGVASSLLMPENLRVEGWRIRLWEFYADPVVKTEKAADLTPELGLAAQVATPVTSTSNPPSLRDLAACWLTWIRDSKPQIVQPLQDLCSQMQDASVSLKTITAQLNQLLLEQTAQLPLRLKVIGATDKGPQRSHNEDTCYPTLEDLRIKDTPPHSILLPHVSIVCDGIGGHEGGEVASQLAVRSLQLQMRALLIEITEQTELSSPDLIIEQLEATVRVVNNLIATQNDTQGRSSRQRMGTTLVMALQLPQQVSTPTGANNAHELYLVHVGDSRAYWITPSYCHQLTVDDDVISREVKMGRSLYREVLHRSDMGALTQAIGTRDAEFLHPHVQRFILDEDGVLLLCSDGLSDNGWVEKSWANYAGLIIKEKISLEAAVQTWLEIANEENGHDNTSVVLLHCHVSPDYPQLFEPGAVPNTIDTLESELSEASRALLYGEAAEEDGVEEPVIAPTGKDERRKTIGWAIVLGLLLFLAVCGAAGLLAWSQIDPAGFQQIRERLLGGETDGE